MRVGVIAVVAALCACASAPKQPADVARVAGNGFDGVIFSAEYGNKTFFKSGRKLWTPTRRQILRFERAVGSYAQAHAPTLARKLPSLKRQYIGLFESNRPLISVGLFCAEFEEWESRILLFAEDGGDCNCHATFDPQSNTILNAGCAGS